ncbi:MAG: glycoside hydrolase family 113 [Streptosporangiaceae bacterium]
MNTSRKLLTGVLVLGLAVGGCSAASHIGALQPPKIKPRRAPLAPAAVRIPRPAFQAGAGIDLYGYKNENYDNAAAAEVTYLKRLHANAVIVSFPFFMHGARARGVYAKPNKTPTPAQLAIVAQSAETAGMYVSLRPLLANFGLGVPRNTWRPARIRAWFASYQRFLLPYAKMAQRNKVPTLYVGTEFQDFGTSPLWNRLDRAVRRVYKGTLAYANNGHLLHPGTGGRLAKVSADSYPDMRQMGPNASVAKLARAWEAWDRPMPRGTVLSEVGIAGVRGAYAKPWQGSWPNPRLDADVQVRWFTAACKAAVATHRGGIYFWAIGFGAAQLIQPLDSSHQSAWESGPGSRAIAACFGQLSND